jgi:integrase
VPAADVVLETIAAHLQRYPLPDPPADPDSIYHGGYPIFRNTKGLGIHRNRLREAWLAAARRSGLPAGKTFHDLRDYFASALIAENCDVKIVMEVLGHASAEETLRTYAKLWRDSEDKARVAISVRFRTPQSPSADEQTTG